jgi:hypothetical protein
MRFLITCAVALTAALLVACGGDDDDTNTPTEAAQTSPAASESPTGSPSAAATASPTTSPVATVDTALDVTLSEFQIELDAESGPPGTYTFGLTNAGEGTHEFMIVQTNLAPDALPSTAEGVFDPAGGDATILAQSPDIAGGGTDTARYELEAGKYVFICNNVDSEGQGHYGKGMSAAFTVE